MVTTQCSLHNPLEPKMKQIISRVLERHYYMNNSGGKLTFYNPKTRRQPEGYKCEYYVMKHMLKIVFVGIVDS
ncbi:unnamed protein product [Lathyrus oleraceus]